MTDELENRLRRALRPLDAPDGFTERLMQRLPQASAQQSPVLVALPAPKKKPARHFGLPAAMAASLLAAVLLGQQIADDRLADEEAAGRAASQEIMQALRVTSEKLDMAYEAVNPDVQENPS
jgi:hypothetical protein